MDSVWQSNATGVPPIIAPGSAVGYPQSGGGIPATVPGAWWYYMMTQEMRNAIAAAGITPDPAQLNQLDAAIVARAAAAAASVNVSLQGFRSTVGVFPRNYRVAIIGSSIERNGIDNTANETRNANRGMTHWMPFLTEQVYESPQSLNFGVSGSTSEGFREQVEQAVQSGAGVCVVGPPTNDLTELTSGGAPFTLEVTQSNMMYVFSRLAAANILCLAYPIFGRKLEGEALYSYPQRYNEWLRGVGYTLPGFKYVEPVEFTNQYSLTYSPRAGYTWGSDELHPTGIGSFTLTRPGAEYLNTLVPRPAPAVRTVCDYFSVNDPRGVLTPNPLMGGPYTGEPPAGGLVPGVLGSGVTGTVPAGMRVQKFANGGNVSSLNVVCSQSTNSRTGGVNLRILVTGTAVGGYDTSVILDFPGGIPNIDAGDVLEAFSDVEIYGDVDGKTVGISGVECFMSVFQNGTEKWVRDGYPIVSDDYLWRSAVGRFRTPKLPLSGALGASSAGIKISLKNVGDTRYIDLRVNNFAPRKVV